MIYIKPNNGFYYLEFEGATYGPFDFYEEAEEFLDELEARFIEEVCDVVPIM